MFMQYKRYVQKCHVGIQQRTLINSHSPPGEENRSRVAFDHWGDGDAYDGGLLLILGLDLLFNSSCSHTYYIKEYRH